MRDGRQGKSSRAFCSSRGDQERSSVCLAGAPHQDGKDEEIRLSKASRSLSFLMALRVVEGPYGRWWACTWCELGAVIPIPRSKGVGVAMDHRGSDPRVALQPALRGSGGPSQRLLGSLMA